MPVLGHGLPAIAHMQLRTRNGSLSSFAVQDSHKHMLLYEIWMRKKEGRRSNRRRTKLSFSCSIFSTLGNLNGIVGVNSSIEK